MPTNSTVTAPGSDSEDITVSISPQQEALIYTELRPLSRHNDTSISLPESSTKVSSSDEEQEQDDSSLREMLTFAIPALGIFLANPLLSNIDNAFVGRTAGAAGLAALSPATICTDQAIYLFSCLASATTNIVSRVYCRKGSDGGSRIERARLAASAPYTVSFITGTLLSLLYAVITPRMLNLLNVDVALHPAASAYMYWRGFFSWAALAQSVSLSILLATRDALTPLAVVSLAVAINIAGDGLLCVWPFRLGCAGAAAASSFSTLVSTAFMLRVLAKKKLLPKLLRMPQASELKELWEYCCPLFLITLARFTAYAAMQFRAMSLDVVKSAAYQISVNTMMFFMLFGEPLSQLGQTKLPALIDAEDRKGIIASIKSIMTLSGLAAVGIGGLAYSLLRFGSGFFTNDVLVQGVIAEAAPSVFASVAMGIVYCGIDGMMFGSRDFNTILALGIMTCVMQLNLLPMCTSLTGIFMTFVARQGIFSLVSVVRAAMGQGNIGRIIGGLRLRRNKPRAELLVGVTN
eukprot:CAMPEP_0172481074 /NCGR_PEP_ID=MMETSP1066-20121228/6632_1 /TAXON_ID=671091 /ORGANISM="Coscinodiscus wailesii, Strain CCMP2513" /LENGTH=519 /DNA_ID=CAMNT_0013243009 /DNA_START=386 /DNA_END=1945 /DNA_ORIENTATION=+